MRNKKGFIMVETLIVAVFIMGIFTYYYTKIIPLTGEYERVMTYDNIDTTYALFQVRKKLLENKSSSLYTYTNVFCYKKGSTSSYVGSGPTLTGTNAWLAEYMNVYGIERICFTNYQVPESIRSTLKTSSTRAWQEYIDDLPTYIYNKDNADSNAYNLLHQNDRRLIVEMSAPFISPVIGDSNHDSGYRYGNLEVNKQ